MRDYSFLFFWEKKNNNNRLEKNIYKKEKNLNLERHMYLLFKLYNKKKILYFVPIYCGCDKEMNWATSQENLSSCLQPVRHKLACSVTETIWSLEIVDLASIGIILSKQWTTKVLIRLGRCAGWSAPLLFVKTGFLMMWLNCNFFSNIK